MSDPFVPYPTRSLDEPASASLPPSSSSTTWKSMEEDSEVGAGFGFPLMSRFELEVVDGDEVRSSSARIPDLPIISSPSSIEWDKRAPGIMASKPPSRSGSQGPPSFRPPSLHAHSQSLNMPTRPASTTSSTFPLSAATLGRSASSQQTTFPFPGHVGLAHSHSDSVASAPSISVASSIAGSTTSLPNSLGRGHPSIFNIDRRPSSRAESARSGFSGSHRTDSADLDIRKSSMNVPATDTRTQLFVGNLPFRCRWQDSKDLFRKVGTVLRADVALTPDNRSKGYGTVLFANYEDAMKAIDTYNGFTWQGRVLDVRIDQQDPTGAQTLENANRQAAAQQAAAAGQSQPALWQPGMPFPHMQNMPPNLRSPFTPNMQVGPISISRPSSSLGQSSPSITSNAIDGISQGSHRPPLNSLPLHLLASFANPNGSSMSGTPNSGGMFAPPTTQNPYSPYTPSLYTSTNGVIPPHYANRHLFVGNLPFNVQWQDLKDLFRNAGNILRADVTLGPDGRSRGFGTVLFSTPEDAQKAVNMYNGHEWHGRQLKVHFDKYSQPPQMVSHSPYHSPMSFPLQSPLIGSLSQNAQVLIPSQVAMTAFGPMSPMTLQPNPFDSIHQSHSAPDNVSTSTTASTLHSSARNGMEDAEVNLETTPSASKPAPLLSTSTRIMPPGTIKLPANPFHYADPFSPHSGPAPLMTPSMPSFQFHPFPQTPPLLPHFLSPGLGPYSPAIHSPPLFAPNPRINAAPGAPVHLPPNHNPMFPPYFHTFSDPYHPPAPQPTEGDGAQSNVSGSDGTVMLASTTKLSFPEDNTTMQRSASTSNASNAFGLTRKNSMDGVLPPTSLPLQQTTSHSGSFPSSSSGREVKTVANLPDDLVEKVASLELNNNNSSKHSAPVQRLPSSFSVDPDPFSSRRGSIDQDSVDDCNGMRSVRSSSMNVETLRQGNENFGHAKKGSFDPWNSRLDLESEGRRASFADGEARARRMLFTKSIWNNEQTEEQKK